jgi:hypothetical protein
MANTNGAAAPLTDDQRFERLVANALSRVENSSLDFRRWVSEKMLDPRRDYYKECGYPAEGGVVPPEVYQRLYDREPIPARVVSFWPSECWAAPPTVYEDDDAEVVTEFEAAWDALGGGLMDDGAYYRQEEGSPVWSELAALDEQSGVGRCGIGLFGLDDGKALSEPVDGVWPPTPTPPAGGAPRRRLLYFRAFPESQFEVSALDSDWRSPRYGQPVMYNVHLSDPGAGAFGGALPMASQQVHWTRVLHAADNTRGGNRAFGVPRMQPVLNRLLDLVKLYGGSAEMYWKGAFPGLVIETDPALDAPDVDVAQLRETVENWEHKLSRFLGLIRMRAKTLAPVVVDPTPQIKAQLEAVCIQLDVPMRIFMGSERGELASGQDARRHARRVMARQRLYCTPRLVRPFVGRLVAAGVLPRPKLGYKVEWPDLAALGEAERADVAVKLSTALATLLSAGAETMIPPLDILTRIFGWDEAAAKAVLENAVRGAEDDAALSPEGLSPTTREVQRASVGEAVLDALRLSQQQQGGKPR